MCTLSWEDGFPLKWVDKCVMFRNIVWSWPSVSLFSPLLPLLAKVGVHWSAYMHGNLTDTSSYKECFCQLIIIWFFFSLKDYLENNDSASETLVWEFLVDLSLVSTFNFNFQVRFEFVGFQNNKTISHCCSLQ